VWGEVPTEASVPIAFPIPMPTHLENVEECGESGNPECQIHVVGEGGKGPAECEEGTSINPKAAPGNLCIYVTSAGEHTSFRGGRYFIDNPEGGSEEGGEVLPITTPGQAGKSGAVLNLETTSGFAGFEFMQGDWVVTAP
jgi:hypothetical protein